MLCSLKGNGLTHHKSQCEGGGWGGGIIGPTLTISIKDVFTEAAERFIETKEKFVPHEFVSVVAE